MAVSLPTFAVVVVLVYVVGDSTSVPLISGAAAMTVVEVVLDLVWDRRGRRSRES